jgi:hypothetical protein
VQETGTHLSTHFGEMLLVEYHRMIAMSVHAVQTGHGTLVPEKYNTQVIPWTQRKRFAENLGGGGLEVIVQGGADSDQQFKHQNLAQ